MLITAYRLVMTGAGLQASVGMMAAIAQIEVLCLGGYLVIKGHLSLGTLLAAISLAPSVLQPVNQLSQTTQNAQAAAGSMSRIQELLDEPPGIVDRPDAIELDVLRDEIVLEDVTLAYGPGRPALDSTSLRIPIGAHVAFVGPSGAGKTSLLNLLLRFYDPTSGRVLVDGHDMRDVSVESLRRQFGVILQDTFIFNTTVRANIAFGRPDATDEQVVAAAEAAQLHEFIAGLPAGYETVLGDRGVRMSGGQRQRLAIARALLRDPTVLILDEATSALDARTEADLRRSLADAGAGRTVVSISHRLTSIVDSDRIFVLAGGRLAEQGTHEELLAAGGLYYQLWTEQQGGGAPVEVPMGVGAASALAAVPLLAHVPPPILDELARIATREHYGPGAEVAGSDGPAGRLLVVLEGELEFVRDAPGGGPLAAHFGPGDFIGELSLVREQRLPAPLRALTRGAAAVARAQRLPRRRAEPPGAPARGARPTRPPPRGARLGGVGVRRRRHLAGALTCRAAAPSPPACTGRRCPAAAGCASLATIASVLVLVGAPVLVVLLASTESVTASAPEIRPGSTDPLEPSAPFLDERRRRHPARRHRVLGGGHAARRPRAGAPRRPRRRRARDGPGRHRHPADLPLLAEHDEARRRRRDPLAGAPARSRSATSSTSGARRSAPTAC